MKRIIYHQLNHKDWEMQFSLYCMPYCHHVFWECCSKHMRHERYSRVTLLSLRQTSEWTKYASVKLGDPGWIWPEFLIHTLRAWKLSKEENCLLMSTYRRQPNTRLEQAIECLLTCLVTESYVSTGAWVTRSQRTLFFFPPFTWAIFCQPTLNLEEE